MSKTGAKREILVFAHWEGLKEPALMGVLHSEMLRGKEVFSFDYEASWLQSKWAQELDPDLQLYSGRHYLNDEKPNFGLFLDSSPDRWGRVLMRRREAALARKESRPEKELLETDYLLGVYDHHRIGALRFKLEMGGAFLNDNREMAAPPWTSIRELEEISLMLDDDDAYKKTEYLKWLNMLIAPGSSLGGARPKASVVDPDGQLWIAKFPSRQDLTDIGGWEMVAYRLARSAGIDMSESQARKFSTRHHTFLTRRFDRKKTGERMHVASAMTLLGYTVGQDYQDGASYLDLVDFISRKGAKVETDLEELWRRIVFSICVSNTDDHLRNHGFMLTPKGWVLSPAYDINPVETGTGLCLNISENDNLLSLELALEVHEYFRLSGQKAREIISAVRNSVRNWRTVARQLGIPKAEQDLKARAFSRAE